MKNEGFTLIESLIYVFCLISFTLVFISIVNLYINIKDNISLINYKLQIFTAAEILKDYLRRAPKFKYFKSIERNSLIYKDSDLDVGFIVNSNNLYKYKGRYINKKWRKKRSSLIAQNINYIDFKVEKDILIVDILDFKNNIYRFFILNRSGVII